MDGEGTDGDWANTMARRLYEARQEVRPAVVLPRDVLARRGDVRTTPKFLPWCERAEVIERTMPVRDRAAAPALRRRAPCVHDAQHACASDASVEVDLVDGPFSLRGPVALHPAQTRRPATTRPRPAASSSTCATPSAARRWRRWSARCSTASPTPSSIPSSNVRRAEDVIMARAERRTSRPGPRAGEVAEVESGSARRRDASSRRSAPAA